MQAAAASNITSHQTEKYGVVKRRTGVALEMPCTVGCFKKSGTMLAFRSAVDDTSYDVACVLLVDHKQRESAAMDSPEMHDFSLLCSRDD